MGDYEDWRRAVGIMLVYFIAGLVVALLCGFVGALSNKAHAASEHTKAASQAMHCQRVAIEYLSQRWKLQVPTVPVEIVDRFNGEHVAEFNQGKITELARVAADCSVMVHELVHWSQWKLEGDCQSETCNLSRENVAYAIQRSFAASTRD